ncbi:MAG TPA: TIGR04563 family protein, partial [Myxococcota bacterium]|nr:TIGR04563 family protein [Myxococcota bacterium]
LLPVLLILWALSREQHNKLMMEMGLMTTTDKRKRSLYFPDNILREMQSEAKRQERSLSWIVQYAWRIARAELMRLPSVGEGGFQAEDDSDEGQMDDLDQGVRHRPQHGSNQFSNAGSFSPHGR